MNSDIVITSGIHGDEPAGVYASYLINKLYPKIPIYPLLNPIAFVNNSRRLHRKDLNRQFDKDDKLANTILKKILSHNPAIVINLHEDIDKDCCYAYCEPNLKDVTQKALIEMRRYIKGIPTSVYNDTSYDGVITSGRIPPAGSLENELIKYNINYITLETPTNKDMKLRIKSLIVGVDYLIKNLSETL